MPNDKDPPTSGKYCNGCKFDDDHATYDRHCDKFKVQLVADEKGTVRCNFCTDSDAKSINLKNDGDMFSFGVRGAKITMKREGDTILLDEDTTDRFIISV